jgi:hypothetical protein
MLAPQVLEAEGRLGLGAIQWWSWGNRTGSRICRADLTSPVGGPMSLKMRLLVPRRPIGSVPWGPVLAVL